MRKFLIVFLCSIVLSSCSDSKMITVIEDDKKLQIESIEKEYEEKLNLLIVETLSGTFTLTKDGDIESFSKTNDI